MITKVFFTRPLKIVLAKNGYTGDVPMPDI